MTLFRMTKQIPVQEKIAELESRIQELEKLVKNQKRMLFTLVYGGNPVKMELSPHWERGWRLVDAAWKEFGEAFKNFF